MTRLNWSVIYFCVALSMAELLGPESRKDKEKISDDDSGNSVKLDPNSKVSTEFIEKLTDAVQKEMEAPQNAADITKNNLDKNKESEDSKEENFKEKGMKKEEKGICHKHLFVHKSMLSLVCVELTIQIILYLFE